MAVGKTDTARVEEETLAIASDLLACEYGHQSGYDQHKHPGIFENLLPGWWAG